MIEFADKDGNIRGALVYGHTCETCRYFSDRVAAWRLQDQIVKAWCLNKDSPHHQKYQPSDGTCSQYYKGVPIDARNEQ